MAVKGTSKDLVATTTTATTKVTPVKPTLPKREFKGAVVGFGIGIFLAVITHYFIFILIASVAGFFLVDRVVYKNNMKLYNERLDIYNAHIAALEEEQRLKEQKKEQNKLKATQRKNRLDKASLYENIYTVAGYVIALEDDLSEYIENAEKVIAHFNANDDERTVAVEAFNRALDPAFDIDSFVKSYVQYIGTNRDYISCVLTYAYIIASKNEVVNEKLKERLYNLGIALGSAKTTLKKLFKSNGAEARFAMKDKENLSESTDISVDVNENAGASSDSRKKTANPYSSKASQTEEALEILGLTKSASFDEIKRAHKKLMLQYHPDRLASKHLSEDMIAIYTEKAKAIQVAFAFLEKEYKDFL